MKLVEIDDNALSPCANSSVHIDDESYSKPRVLSTLDNVMNKVLRAQISDADKWMLYSQTLQKYLNHAKVNSRKSDCNFAYPVNDSKSVFEKEKEDTFNFSLGNISNEISGIDRIRDSLDSISQPSVKSFFENARQQNSAASRSPLAAAEEVLQDSPPPKVKKIKKKSKLIQRALPYRKKLTAEARKRRAENSLSVDISRMRPCKVSVQRINWEPTAAR